MLHEVVTEVLVIGQDQICNAVEDQDVAMFMDDTTPIGSNQCQLPFRWYR